MKKAVAHVHKLQRQKYRNGTKVYFCILNCNYKIEVAFALGKETICHICGQQFTMNEYTVKLAKPHCQNCGKRKILDDDGNAKYVQKGRQERAIAEIGMSSAHSLRSRLDRAVAIAQDEDL
jgi:hypothetical protein